MNRDRQSFLNEIRICNRIFSWDLSLHKIFFTENKIEPPYRSSLLLHFQAWQFYKLSPPYRYNFFVWWRILDWTTSLNTIAVKKENMSYNIINNVQQTILHDKPVTNEYRRSGRIGHSNGKLLIYKPGVISKRVWWSITVQQHVSFYVTVAVLTALKNADWRTTKDVVSVLAKLNQKSNCLVNYWLETSIHYHARAMVE